jgi:hypothetical protein
MVLREFHSKQDEVIWCVPKSGLGTSRFEAQRHLHLRQGIRMLVCAFPQDTGRYQACDFGGSEKKR